MASPKSLGIIQIVVGIILTAVGAGAIGVPLIVSGIATTAAAILAPRPPDPVDRLDQRRRPGISSRLNSPNRRIPIAYGRTLVDSPPLIWGPDVKDIFRVKDDKNYQTAGRISFKAAWGVCIGEIHAIEEIYTSTGLRLTDIIKQGSIINKLGTKDQAPIDDMNKQVRFTPLGFDLLRFDKDADTTIGEVNNELEITTSSDVEGFGLVFANPSGLYFREKAEERRGNPGPKSCRIQVDYKPSDQPDSAYQRANHDQSEIPDVTVQRTIITDVSGNQTSAEIGKSTPISKEAIWSWGAIAVTPIRREFELSYVKEVIQKTYRKKYKYKRGRKIETLDLLKTDKFIENTPLKLAKDTYTIRMRNVTPEVYNDDVDAVQVVGIEEISYDQAMAYPHLAYTFLSSEATTNLERSFLDMQFIVHGRKVVDVVDYFNSGTTTRAYSDNAANVVADLLTDSLIGLGYSLDDLDQTSFTNFYNYCEESLEFSEWKTFAYEATGNANTVYTIPDFNENSEVRFVNAGITAPLTYVLTSTGIKFTGSTIPKGPRRNPFHGQPGQPKQLDPDTIRLQYRTNVRRGSVSITFDTQTTYDEAIRAILEPLNAFLYFSNGKVGIAVDKDESDATISNPTAVLDLDVQAGSYVLLDINGTELSDVSKSTIRISSNPRTARANIIRVRYPDADNRFRDDFVQIEDAVGVVENGPVVLEVTMQSLTTRRHAEEYALSLLRKLRTDDLTVQITTIPIGLTLVPGDIISITDSNRGWAGEIFRVTDIRVLSKENGLNAEIQAVPYDESKYTKTFRTSVAKTLRPGTVTQISQTNQYLRTSSAKDANFRVVP